LKLLIYRVAQIKRHHFTFLLQTNESTETEFYDFWHIGYKV